MIAVTGGAGYIGSVAVEKLCDAGHQVVVIDDLRDGHAEAVDERAIFEECVVDDARFLFESYDIDTVIHLAASANVPESIKDPQEYYDNNVVSTFHLLTAMVDGGVKKIIFASTAAIDSNTPYGNSKRACEDMIRDFARAYGIQYYIFRFYCVAGATEKHGESREHETHLIPTVLDVAMGKKDKLIIYGMDYDTGDGTAIRDYIHVEDITDAIISVLPFDKKSNDTIELGMGRGYSVLDIIREVEHQTGLAVPRTHEPRRDGDMEWLVSNAYYARQLIGWQPRKSLSDIISSAYKWRKNPRY
jgi:UDP-glucose 4-epimerase